MKKTLGGDRLGSGKKMKVDLHGFERSTHNMGYIWRSTMSAGTLVPFMTEIALPGDSFDIDLDIDINTHPTIGPLFGSFKVQADTFIAPMRLYQGQLHNNKLGIGMNMANVKLPIMRVTAIDIVNTPPQDIDNAQINPSCLLAYLGLRGVGVTSVTQTRDFHALGLLMYWDIYKNYYANKQEEIGAVIHTPAEALIQTVDAINFNGNQVDPAPAVTPVPMIPGQLVDLIFTGAQADPAQIIINTQFLGDQNLASITGPWTLIAAGHIQATYARPHNVALNWRYVNATDLGIGSPKVATFALENIDIMREEILAHSVNVTPFIIDENSVIPYGWLLQSVNDGLNTIPNQLSSQEGLGLKTYQSDKFNNWLSTEWIDGAGGITEVTAIDTSGGSFTIDTLNLSKKVYDMLNRIAVSGGSYDDYIDAQWAHNRYIKCESPMYQGGLIKELVFQEVVSNSEASTDGATQPLGTLAGKGTLSKKHKGGHITIKVDEPSYIMSIISLTPRLDYSQGNKWDLHLKTMADLHVPTLDEIGFQELITEDMAWWSTDAQVTGWRQLSAGKQPAWINYMTNVNIVRGNFAIVTNEMFMTLNRRYEYDPADDSILDLTTYIDPSKFNYIFAETALDAQNYWVQIAVDMTVRRKMSAKIMPNL